jgi:hypothetical protein
LVHRHGGSVSLDDDDPALVVQPLFITAAAARLDTSALPELAFNAAPPATGTAHRVRLTTVPIHGPPRGPRSLRAPPFVSSL